ncbi:predicted protein [Uncinocarpus reesii 1704]|uniref:Uncharacterized protein n=1 Tax=Uncinocarpus reesii (strain UAMH 1704) TaxID=336963 RepID=C4JNS1_UNCRE|nr:uncharacterized protein UREG_04391 [Uncinocarpus reesii 1704]EEP79545.1 predicted protein [Uncinocarpus reesii 1704]
MAIYIAAGVKIFAHEKGVQSLTAQEQLMLDGQTRQPSQEQESGSQQPSESRSSCIVPPNDSMTGEQRAVETRPSSQASSTPENQRLRESSMATTVSSERVFGPQNQNRPRHEHELISQNNCTPDQILAQRYSNFADTELAAHGSLAQNRLQNLGSLESDIASIGRLANRNQAADFERRLDAQLEGLEKGPGFWNGVIFFSTSWDAVRESYGTLKSPRDLSAPLFWRQLSTFFVTSLWERRRIRFKLPWK